MSPLEEAALEWWRGRRPVDWSEWDHLGNPTINCTTASEINLAEMVAEFVGRDRKADQGVEQMAAEVLRPFDGSKALKVRRK